MNLHANGGPAHDHTDKFAQDVFGALRPPEAPDLQLTQEVLTSKPLARNTQLTPEFDKRVVVLGSGAYGTALASVLARNGLDVLLYVRSEEVARSINEDGIHPKINKDLKLPTTIRATTDLTMAVEDRGIILLGAPAAEIGNVASQIIPHKDAIVINLAKGFCFPDGFPFPHPDDFLSGPVYDNPRICLPLQVLEQLPQWQGHKNLVTLSGAGFAENIIRGKRVTLMLASENTEATSRVHQLLANETTFLHETTDTVGVQLAGALKNVVALAGGILRANQERFDWSPEEQDNLYNALVTEARKLYVPVGENQWQQSPHRTFVAPPIASDFTMCFRSEQSRNYRAGAMIGNGASVVEILQELGTVEGLANTWAAKILGDQVEFDTVSKCLVRCEKSSDTNFVLLLPIINALVDVIKGEKDASAIVDAAYPKVKRNEPGVVTLDEAPHKGDATLPIFVDRSRL